MPLQATSGAASYDAFGGGAATAAKYIEDVFQTWLYTGNGTGQTITNGIDLAGKGGLVWIKRRNGATGHSLIDTARGTSKTLLSNATLAEVTYTDSITSFNSNGFSLGADTQGNLTNLDTSTYVSWTFREQPKFFDVVTYTGNGANRTIPHNLGSVPGCIIVKVLNTTASWGVYHRSLGNDKAMFLNLTLDAQTSSTYWNNTSPTATEFSLGTDSGFNGSGNTYVAYLFAHNAGGFGLTGTDNVISCGSYVGDGTTRLINIGYEPQWILIKNASNGVGQQANWRIVDNMRGFTATGNSAVLRPNLSDAENNDNPITIDAQGFNTENMRNMGETYIYIAIRRGPMKTPTTGTSVFSPILANVSNTTKLTTNFPVDLSITNETAGGGAYWMDRLRGALSPGLTGNTPYLQSSNTGADTLTPITSGWDNTGLLAGPFFGGVSAVRWNLRRAPGFFDEVCYTGTGSATTQAHNLGVVPELMIVKRRNGIWDWMVYTATDGAEYYYWMNATNARRGPWTGWNNTTPTSSVFSLGAEDAVNASGSTYVNYLFASCPGVSKVGSYTGNGSSQTINMGFTGGARFFLVKRTDSTGDWWVYDSARGIVSAADPALRLNSTAAEVTSADAVDTDSTGLIVNQESTCNINVSSATYIYLGIS